MGWEIRDADADSDADPDADADADDLVSCLWDSRQYIMEFPLYFIPIRKVSDAGPFGKQNPICKYVRERVLQVREHRK